MNAINNTCLDKVYKMFEWGVEVSFFSERHNLLNDTQMQYKSDFEPPENSLFSNGYLEVLVVDVSIHSEQPLQDGFGNCL